MTEKIGGQLVPLLTRLFSPKSYDKNSEIVILLNTVKVSNSLRPLVIKQTFLIVAWEWPVSYEICPFFTHSICHWEVNRHFWGMVEG